MNVAFEFKAMFRGISVRVRYFISSAARHLPKHVCHLREEVFSKLELGS